MKQLFLIFDPSDPVRNFLGHALIAFVFSYGWTLAIGPEAGTGAGMSVYGAKELGDIGTRLAEDKEPDWKDGAKDFMASAPGTALGVALGVLTRGLIGVS